MFRKNVIIGKGFLKIRTNQIIKTTSFFLFFCLLFSLPQLIVSAAIPEDMDVLYIGEAYENWQDRPAWAALSLDDTFNITQTASEAELDIATISSDTYEVAFIQDYLISNESIDSLKTWIEEGNSLIILMGSKLTQNTSIFKRLGIFNDLDASKISAGIDSATFEPNKTSLITSSIYWNSVPGCTNYTVFPVTPDISNNILMQKLPQPTSLRHEKDPLIFNHSLGSGNVVIFSMWIEEEQSIDFAKSSYFNYLIYSATITQGGLLSEKLEFNEWEKSPIPQGLEILLLFGLLAIALFFVLLLIRRAKNKSKSPIKINNIKEEISEEEVKEEVKDEAKEEEKGEERKEENKWEQIGFHRQISGYFTGLIMGLLGGLPMLILSVFVYPTFINPFPNTQGNYILVKDLFIAIWTVVDFGTTFSMVTYFNKHRIERPEKAVHYIQIYVYWQLISGFMQLTAVTIVSTFIITQTGNFAYMSYFFILHSMIQFPGFLSVMTWSLFAIQRSDLHQIGTLLVYAVFTPLGQYIGVIVCRLIFMNDIMYGEMFGVIVGLTVGDWLGFLMEYKVSGWMLKKTGYSGKTFFRWDFSKEEIKEVLRYGLDLVIGQVWYPVVTALQAFLITIYITDYATQYGLYNLAFTVGTIGMLGTLLTTNLQAPIAEAFTYQEEYGKRLYLERLFLSSFHMLNLLNTAILSSLLVVGTKIIFILAPDQWSDAEFFVNAILIMNLVQPYSQMIDPLFQGTSKTRLLMVFWIIEQFMRGLMLIIMMGIFSFGLAAIPLAQVAGMIVKAILGIIFCRKEITNPKINLWQIWGAPFLTGILNFSLLVVLDIFLDDIIIILLGLLFSFSLFGLISAWLGAWDENQIKEYTLANNISKKGLKLILSVFLFSVNLGMKIPSPLAGKFKIDIWEDAQQEINELQAMKKELIM
ncbi:MAG: lipopolysaccharide biosynthesis protein [archaeon]|nr:lipopolysaccharide biosynthesis protein [archaeon]